MSKTLNHSWLLKHHSLEYAAIKTFYGRRCAKRSKVPLINHIDQGLAIIRELNGAAGADYAFCIHPLFQGDKELTTVGRAFCLKTKNPFPVMLAMEYRQWANAWLADKVTKNAMLNSSGKPVKEWIETVGEPSSGPFPAVREMLIADKVQNRKDFLEHHKGRHKRSDELDFYFTHWLKVLGICERDYLLLCKAIDKEKAK